MIDIKQWLNVFCERLENTFGRRVDFVGLQGSYGRGEATGGSDIDVVVVLNELTIEDLKKYNTMLDELPHRDLICGFISGKKELKNWETSDLFQFYFDTTPIKGDLGFLQSSIDSQSVKRAIRIGACNIYHMCVHNMLHEKDMEILKSLYKSAVFTLQATHYDKTGEYIKKKEDLIKAVGDAECEILDAAIALKNGENIKDFEKLSEQLFYWARDLLDEYKQSGGE